MEFLRLVKETEELDKDIKRQEKDFKLSIKEKVKTHKSKKKEIKKYLKEAINSREYEYREIEVKSFSCFGKRNTTTYYPFLKLDDEYEIKEESFYENSDSHDDNYGLYHEYTLYNKNNKMEIKVKECSTTDFYIKGSNEVCDNYYYRYYPKEQTINATWC